MPQAKGSGRKRPPPRRSPRRRPLRRRRRRVNSRRRLLALLILSVLAFLAISGRLVVLQVFDAGSLDQAAARQRLTVIDLPATRGRIFDRNLNDLAISVPARAIWADPRLVKDKPRTAARLAKALGVKKATLAGRLASKGRFVYLARRIPKFRGDVVQRMNLPGIFVVADVARRYPSGTVAAQVLGFVDIDGHGQAGIEQQYDGLLRGHPGKIQLERDPQGRAIPQGRRSLEPAEPGTDLVLTIDQHLQYVTEQALYRAVREHKAKAGSVVVMSPRSGEVLAMANVPTFDPNRIAASKPEARKNRAIADVFEPGSTNKTITAAAALQHGIVTPRTETIVPDNIPLCPEKTFRDSHSHAPELMTFADIVAKSSNVGTIMAARDLGRDRLYQAELDFGYGRKQRRRPAGRVARDRAPGPELVLHRPRHQRHRPGRGRDRAPDGQRLRHRGQQRGAAGPDPAAGHRRRPRPGRQGRPPAGTPGAVDPAPPAACPRSSRAWSRRAAPAPRPPWRSGGWPARPAPPASPTPGGAATARAPMSAASSASPRPRSRRWWSRW